MGVPEVANWAGENSVIEPPDTAPLLDTHRLPKGSKVFVEGEIRHDRYTDKGGQERFFSKVVVTTPQHELKSLDKLEPAEAADEN